MLHTNKIVCTEMDVLRSARKSRMERTKNERIKEITGVKGQPDIIENSGVQRGGGLGCSNTPRNSEDIGGVLDRISKKNRRLDFHL